MLFFLKNFAQKVTIGAVNPLPAKRISGFKVKQIKKVLKNAKNRKRGRGLRGTLKNLQLAGAVFFASEWLKRITLLVLLSSSAICQFKRSMPPINGGRLRVIMRIFFLDMFFSIE